MVVARWLLYLGRVSRLAHGAVVVRAALDGILCHAVILTHGLAAAVEHGGCSLASLLSRVACLAHGAVVVCAALDGISSFAAVLT